MENFDFSLFYNEGDENVSKSYTGAFIKKWCEHHLATGKTTGNPYYEAYTIYKNHWENSDYKPNPNAYYYTTYSGAKGVGYILKRDKKLSPKKEA